MSPLFQPRNGTAKKKRNKDVYEKIEKSNAKMCNEINAQMKCANNIMMPDVSENVPLIIKPKVKQSVEKTKAELNEKVNPINLKITNVEKWYIGNEKQKCGRKRKI